MKDIDTRRKRSLGQSVVEFALVAPIFLMLLFGLIEGARLVYAYNTVNHAAQESARFAILADTSSVSAVRNKAVDAADPLEINTSDVTVQVNNGSTSFGDREIGDRLSVSVTYNLVPVVGMVFGATPSFELTGKTELMVE